MSELRTRFAPSPTGYIHLGSMRTALFSYLLARHSGGQFIIRLEDTDQAREVEGAKQHIVDSLGALALDYDEGPGKDGPYGPYVQSERLPIYKKWADLLIERGRAYSDPYSPEEVQAFRSLAKANKQPFLYRRHRPEEPPAWDGTRPLRFLSEPKPYTWQDKVMGDIKTSESAIDDFILMKSDGYPTYNFAHIVDDIEMKITHVLRGQEFLSSVPNYLNLYEALGVSPPEFVTLPHVMAPIGNTKLSKRDGAKDILDYIRDGYLPEALISFMATLGWSDGTTKEMFTREELIEKFDVGRIQKSGARFDQKRLDFINGHFIRDLKIDELAKRAESFWSKEAEGSSEAYKKQVLATLQDRLKYLNELAELSQFFFVDLPVNPKLISENKQLNKLSNDELKNLLVKAKDELNQSDFSLDDLNARLNHLLEEQGQKPAVLFGLIRIATTQAPASPGLADTLNVLGKDKVLRRIEEQIKVL